MSIKLRLILGFGGLILLMAISMGLTMLKVSNVQQEANTVIDKRQPAVHHFHELATEVNLATTLLNSFLLTGYEEHKNEYQALEKNLASHFKHIKHLNALSNETAKRYFAEAEELLARFQAFGQELLIFGSDREKNFPGMTLAIETLNPPAAQFLSLTNRLLDSENFDLSNDKERETYRLLQEIRYHWVQMMGALRVYLNSRLQGNLINFRAHFEKNGELLEELIAMDMDIGFGELEEMAAVRKNYFEHVPPVLEIFKTDAWRADAHFLKTDVRPVVDRLRYLLKELANEQVAKSKESGDQLTASIGQIQASAIIVMVLAIAAGILLTLLITRSTIPSIRRLMDAAKLVADGDLNAEVMITSRDEIGQLGKSFNTMVDNLRSATLKEQQYTEDLKALNHQLEDRVHERTQELKGSEAKIRAILDNIGEGIIVINNNGSIESINPAAERTFGLDKENAIGMDSMLLFSDHELGKSAANDSAAKDSLFAASNNEQPTEREGKHSDGTTFPMEFVVTPMQLDDKLLRVCIVRDITLRKETESSLAQAQQQLVDAAHKSGMAEMATGVLHNIGNILNSVNLSGEEIARFTKQSKVSGLIKANEILAEHKDELATFLSQDPKGQKLPDYYIKLGNILSQEIQSIADETESLLNKTTMMKEVIATQQSYAKQGFHSEMINLNTLIEDALKIQEASLHKWGVKLEKRLSDIPTCVAQKSKLLQVITNLIKNAQEAMRENDIYNRPKELFIETGIVDNEVVFVKVNDNGCGIPSDKLSKIFNHGFTTKTDGHGFGLHTSANAMTEMKGSLSVDSKGVQEGACFTLTVPINRAA